MIRAIARSLALVLLVASAARAEVTVAAKLSTATAYAGEPVSLTIAVNGSRAPEEPIMPPVAGLTIRALGGQDVSRSSTTIINGRVFEDRFDGYLFQYELAGLAPGEVTIPALDVRVDGRVYQTQPQTLRVLAPQKDQDVVLRLEADRASVYAGEPVMLRVTLGLGKSVNAARFTLPGVEGVFEVATTGQSAPRRGEVSFSLLDREVPTTRGVVTVDGVEYTAYTAELALIPRRAGSFVIGPATAACEVMVAERRTIFDRDVTRRAVVPSNPVRIEVRPLPTEGRPPNFNGLVGRYLISTEASESEVSVGDPIRLSITVRGPLPGSVPAPDLERQPALAGDFRVGAEQPKGIIEPGRVRFDRELRAQHDRVTEIPPIELPYFNVETGRFEVARSDAIPLRVRPTRTVTTADGFGAVGEAPAPSGVLESNSEGIAHNFTGPDALHDQRFSLARSVLSPVGVATVVAPPALYAGLGVIALVRRSSQSGSDRRRRSRALVTARGALSQPSDAPAAAVSRALRLYAGLRTGRNPDGLTAQECADAFAPAGESLQSRARELLARCDASEYGGASSSSGGGGGGGGGVIDERSIDEASRLLGEIDRVLTGRKP
ncbi:MAG TPA: hypothetical protein DEB06_05825 [Phycisphaerales bacterium]|nr:hypothetical protein [Phycisphaerales bacterium]